MYKKIAKKILLITLLGFMILGGINAPEVKLNAPTVEAAGLPWTQVTPKKTTESAVKGDDGTKNNSCNTCFVAVKTGTIWNLLSAPLDTVLSLIPRILVFVIKWIVILLAKLLQALMAPQGGGLFFKLNQFMPTYNEAGQQTSFVYWLWSVSLYYANILITLFLIWIAINIILEKKEYTSYQNLIKLIGVALLVNFSLVICAVFVDISNFIATLFMSNIAMNSFSCMYACTIHKVANIFNCKQDNMIFSLTISNSLALMVGLVFVGQILGLIMYVLTRMIYLWFLVGLSPIAFVLSAIPETRKYYKQWVDLFTANLIKLPALAFASYFILNMMLYISNNYMMSTDTSSTNWMQNILGMGNNTANENLWVSTLGIVFILFILSQALLSVAQSLGVEQISKASAFTSGWAKKGWEAVKKPAGQKANRIMTSTPLYKWGVAKLKGSKVAGLAKMGDEFDNKAKIEQAKVAKDMEFLYKGKNWRALEKLADSRDPYIKTQSMAYLAQLDKVGDYDIKDGHTKYTEDNKRINKIRDLSKANLLVEDSDAYGVLKKYLPYFKFGADPLTKPEEMKKAIGEVLGVLNHSDKKGNLNLRGTLEVMMKNAGDQLPLFMKMAHQAFTPEQLQFASSSLGNTPYMMFLETIAKGNKVALEIEKSKNSGKPMSALEIEKALNSFSLKNDTDIDYVKNHLIEDAKVVAGDSEYNWFGRYGKKGSAKNQFVASAVGRGFLPLGSEKFNADGGSSYTNNSSTSSTSGNQNANQNSTTNTDQVIQKLRDDIASFSNQLDESHKKIIEEINSFQEEIDAKRNTADALKQDEIDARIVEYQKQIKAWTIQLKKLQEDIKKSGKNDVNLINQSKKLTNQITDLEKKLEDLKNNSTNP